MVRRSPKVAHAVTRVRTPADGDALIKALYREHGHALLLFALTLTGRDREQAEDVVQETLIQAWRVADTLDHRTEQLRDWLFGTARRIVANNLPRPRAELVPQRPEPGPVQTTRVAAASVVYETLQILPREQREVMRLTYLGGLSVNEAAAALSISPDTVKLRIHGAVQELRRALHESGVR